MRHSGVGASSFLWETGTSDSAECRDSTRISGGVYQPNPIWSFLLIFNFLYHVPSNGCTLEYHDVHPCNATNCAGVLKTTDGAVRLPGSLLILMIWLIDDDQVSTQCCGEEYSETSVETSRNNIACENQNTSSAGSKNNNRGVFAGVQQISQN